MGDIITTAKRGVEECYFQHHIKLISPVNTSNNENSFLIDKNILFKIHQWKVVTNVVIRKGDKCEIEFVEYSPFIYNALVRKYNLNKVLFFERFTVEGDDEEAKVIPQEYWIEVLFDKVKLVLHLDVEKVCPIYIPPVKKKKKRRKKKKF